MKIFVYIQQDQGNISSISLEAIVGAQEIAAQTGGLVTAVTFNSQAGEKLTAYDLAEILVVEDENLNTYNPLHCVWPQLWNPGLGAPLKRPAGYSFYIRLYPI